MALQILAPSGKGDFSLEAYKKSQDIADIPIIHGMAAHWLEGYLVNKAAAELERDGANTADGAATPPSPELVPRQRRTGAARPTTDAAGLAEAGLRMAYWDFTEYTWALENLRDDLTPAFKRSCCFFTACVAAKGLQLYFRPSFEYASELTMLTGYHAAFALVYLSCLGLVSHGNRRVEGYRAKLRTERAMSEDDVRGCRNAFVFRAINWLAEMRAFRRCLFALEGISIKSLWTVDLIIHLWHL